MPRNLKDNSQVCKSVTLDRSLCEEVLSRGYNLTEIFNAALADVLQVDDEMQVRYDAIRKAREEMRKRSRELRLTISETQQQKEAAAAAAADTELENIAIELCADWLKLGKSAQAYLIQRESIGEDELEFFNRRCEKMYRSERYIQGLKCVISARGNSIKTLALLRTAEKRKEN